ncbi:MAG TPA: polysaccharide deacetylase family protein [Anaerolineae bacterium]|nr:polysaccharide deacetylase family protein [Anaerolineae bacterium]HOQ99935.1 polysaccharide deacetylase family protein [Anaerolineae bacterium]HPL26836.1 polysaccharide deacetylase family protein [Anaerolineae bacterium]
MHIPARVHHLWVTLGIAAATALLAACALPLPAGVGQQITERATVAAPPQPSATLAPSATPSATATASPLPSPTPTQPPTATPVPTPTATPTPLMPTPDGQARTATVPILMYHYVSDPPAGADAVRRDLSVSPQRFEEQLAYLRDAGYTGITLADLLLYLTTGRPLPAKPVVLTFDDGYADNYANAVPLLQRYGFTGTFFIITGFLDQGAEGYLTWEQAAQMQAEGMDIQAHSMTHPDLRLVGAERLQQEVQGASGAIEAHLGRPARFFCYPSGRYDARTLDALRNAGYWAAVTTAGGAVHATGGLLQLARVRIHGSNDLGEFKGLIAYYTGG